MRTFFILCVFCLPVESAPPYPPVPVAYQDLFNLLNTQVSTFDNAVRAGWNGAPYPVTYAPQFLSASSDQFTALLAPNYYTYTVAPQLEELQALGAKGVTIHINFPILYPAFYTNHADYQNYVAFYQKVAQDVHARGLKLIVETCQAVPLVGSPSTEFLNYYKTLNWNAYMAGRAANAVNVAQLIQPDYMSVITEPDTEATYSTQTNAGTIAGSTQMLQTILTALKGAGSNVPVGAGAGTWMDSSTSNPLTGFVQSFVATQIQYIDLHIYPVNHNDLQAALPMADMAHAAGKQVAISEEWADKVRDSELGVVGLTNISARDPFSFWEPVDIAFLKATVDYAQAKQLLFVSPFWAHYFYAYLDYGIVGLLPPSTVLTESYTAAIKANQVGTVSATGIAWENATVPGTPDTQPPLPPAAPTAVSIGTVAVNLAWQPTTDNVGVAGYRLYRNGVLVSTTSQFTFPDKGLISGATYTYTVTAFDAYGNTSAPSAPLVVTTINITPPTAPTNFKVTGVTKNSVSLSWSPSSDIGGVAGYYELKGSTAINLGIGAKLGNVTSYVDTAVWPNTTYCYGAKGYIASGLAGPPSNTVCTRTLAH